MREILFRGKRVDNGEWVYGYYVCIAGTSHYIYTGKLDLCGKNVGYEQYEVIPETVGQFTGFKDINGERIFEGDIVVIGWGSEELFYIEFSHNSFECRSKKHIHYRHPLTENNRYEVVGNIHDNPLCWQNYCYECGCNKPTTFNVQPW